MERKFGRFAIQGLMKYIILFYVAGYLIEFLAPQAYSFLTLEPYLISIMDRYGDWCHGY